MHPVYILRNIKMRHVASCGKNNRILLYCIGKFTV